MIVSGAALSLTSGKVASAGDVLLKGTSVTIANALDTHDGRQSTKSSSVGLSIGVQSELLQSVDNVADMANIAINTGTDRFAAVAGLAESVAAVNAVDAGKDLAGTLKTATADCARRWAPPSASPSRTRPARHLTSRWSAAR